MTTEWIMPNPSLDDDDRFQVAIGDSEGEVLVGILGPSGIGCTYCGGQPAGYVRVVDMRASRLVCCEEHFAFGAGEMGVKMGVFTMPGVGE